MSKFIKAAAAVAVLATAQMAVAPAAEAGPRHRFIGGLIAGAALSALVVAPRYVYAADCNYLRQRALYNDSIGRHGRAAYFWDRYAACRG